MSLAPSRIALLPLKTVLFPGGVLPLKLSEARHIEMVQDCLAQGRPFGVVLHQPEEAQTSGSAAPCSETVGCLAFVHHAVMLSTGMMRVHATGGERFRLRATRTLQDGRLEAEVEMLAADASGAISQQHQGCARALALVIDDIEAKAQERGAAVPESRFVRPLRLAEAGWVANRWCELLPIPLKARQKLMELSDAQSRLSLVDQYLKQHRIL